MARLGCIATFTVLLLSLIVLGRDFTAHASQGLRNSSFVAVHRSNDVMIKNEPRAEKQITGTGGKGYFRGRRMKGAKVAVTTGAVNQNPAGKLCHEVDGKMSLGCELRHRVRSSGLVLFSSDYHTPNKHPPKNN